ncbi:hypothetical protein [Brevundimonas sp.]|uniref:hypothetical protein n=1 Tax=Brevundimonas sp. TaxID=1871086 RepID=UPI002C0E8915|nr:hypothetical protein [Brevundimonas sp.]HWQ85055.1 hypothetical protein [Brevundimonas sp.]
MSARPVDRSRVTVPLALILAVLNLPILWFGSMWASVPEHRATPDGAIPVVTPDTALPYYLLMGFVVVALVATIILQAKDLKRAAGWTVLLQLVPLMLAYV